MFNQWRASTSISIINKYGTITIKNESNLWGIFVLKLSILYIVDRVRLVLCISVLLALPCWLIMKLNFDLQIIFTDWFHCIQCDSVANTILRNRFRLIAFALIHYISSIPLFIHFRDLHFIAIASNDSITFLPLRPPCGCSSQPTRQFPTVNHCRRRRILPRRTRHKWHTLVAVLSFPNALSVRFPTGDWRDAGHFSCEYLSIKICIWLRRRGATVAMCGDRRRRRRRRRPMQIQIVPVCPAICVFNVCVCVVVGWGAAPSASLTIAIVILMICARTYGTCAHVLCAFANTGSWRTRSELHQLIGYG